MCIVILHTTYMAASLYKENITRIELISSMTMTHLMMSALPCFIMVTGVLLLNPDKEITIKKIYRKYVLRILLALVFFSIIYKLFDICMDKKTISIETIKSFIMELISGGGWSHLWYLYMILALYIILPLYRGFVASADDKTIKYICSIGFVFLCILPVIRKTSGISPAFYIDIATVYPLYMITGYAMQRGIYNTGYGLYLFLIGIAGIIICSLFRYGFDYEYLDALLGYSSPFTFIAATGLFSIFLRINIGDHLSKIVKVIDPTTLGIYSIHIIFLRLILRYMRVNPYKGSALSAIDIIVIAAAAFTISFILTVLLKEIFVKQVI